MLSGLVKVHLQVSVVSHTGEIAMPFNTAGMYRGYIDENGKAVVEIFK